MLHADLLNKSAEKYLGCIVFPALFFGCFLGFFVLFCFLPFFCLFFIFMSFGSANLTGKSRGDDSKQGGMYINHLKEKKDVFKRKRKSFRGKEKKLFLYNYNTDRSGLVHVMRTLVYSHKSYLMGSKLISLKLKL